MGKILCYVYEQMADFEITLLLHRLKNAGGREIVSVSETLSPITAQSGLRFLPDRRIDEIGDVGAYDALIIPGGPIDNEQNAICPVIRAMLGAGKLVAAICFAPQFLGRAGALAGRRYTTSCSEEKIAALGVEDPFDRRTYVEARVVRDGNVVTAKGYAFVDFAAAVLRALGVVTNDAQEYELLGRVKESD